MPVSALFMKTGNWNAIDTCAAPGNKTIQLAEKMKKFSLGTLYAYEKDKKRFEVLKNRIKLANAKNVCPVNSDFFKATNYFNVKIAVVDPSCSGSGILEHQIIDHGKIHYNTDFFDERIQKLSNFQKKILKKTIRISGIEQIVYSTCSVYTAENEKVVLNVMKNC